MQTERLLALANWLEGGAKHSLKIGNRDVVFDMSVGIQVRAEMGEDFDANTCGTACCIAGAAVQFFAPAKANALLSVTRAKMYDLATSIKQAQGNAFEWHATSQVGFYGRSGVNGVLETATELLGLTDEQAMDLFVPNHRPSEHRSLKDFNDPLEAAKVIRRGVETGNFNWDAEYED